MRVGASLALGAQRVPSSSGPAGWPAALATGLLYRYDASVAASLTLSGSVVDAWADQGPSGYHLAHEETGWPDPIYTATGFAGGPAVLFPSGSIASDPLSRANVPGDYSGSRTLALVYQPQATGVVHSAVLVHTNAGAAGLVLREDNTESWCLSTQSYGSTGVRSAAPPKTPQVIICVLGPSVATYERGGVDVSTSPTTGAGSSITGKLSLGARDFSNRSPAAIALAAVWSRALSAPEKIAFYAYCASRWAT